MFTDPFCEILHRFFQVVELQHEMEKEDDDTDDGENEKECPHGHASDTR